MARAEFDMSELEQWTEMIQQAPVTARKQAKGVITKGALNIKNQARKNAPRGAAKHYPKSINFDVTETNDGLEAEIGPAQGRQQWGLGNLLEYGSSHNPPHPHLEPALDEEEPKFLDAAEKIAEGAIWIGGGWATAGGGGASAGAGFLTAPGVEL